MGRSIVGVLGLLAGCDQVFGLDRPDAAPDAPPAGCPAPAYDPARYRATSASGGLSWIDARASCARSAMDLAVLSTGDADELANQAAGATVPFWLGVSFGSGWTSIDDCDPELLWAPTEPAHTEPGYCVLVTATGMAAERCTSMTVATAPIGALCETPRMSETCAALHANSRYAVASTVPVIQPVADMQCAAMGMHLLEINTSEELAYIRQMVAPTSPKFWFGAEYDGAAWGSPTMCPQVFAWKQSEPDLSDENLRCALYDGGAQTAYCSSNMAATICEENLPP